MSEFYGPALPPEISANTNRPIIGPCLPQKKDIDEDPKKHTNLIIGPALPPHLLNNDNVVDEKNQTISKEKIPTLETKRIGPSLPPHLQNISANSTQYNSDSESDEDVYGPVLPEQILKSKAHIALEERALEIKLDKYNPTSSKTEREEWMLELPSVGADKLGLGARQFRSKTGPDFSDRSSWTDTPKNKNKKKEKPNLKEVLENEAIEQRDQQQEKLSKKHLREEDSLLQMHQKKIKKEKTEASTERKAFNRETDLQVNKFDEAQKAAILKKAQALDDRFSRGKSKFL